MQTHTIYTHLYRKRERTRKREGYTHGNGARLAVISAMVELADLAGEEEE